MKLSNKTKSELFRALQKETNLFSFMNHNELMLTFLNDIWDLHEMPSSDSRFKDAYGDIIQHTVNNDDWTIDYLFLERLNLFQDDNIYFRFLENLVKAEYRTNDDEVMKFVLLINSYLEREELVLTLYNYDENEQAIYSVQKLEDKDTFIDIVQNQIPFYVVKTPNDQHNIFSSHKKPRDKLAFVLVHNNKWNDYSAWTIFALFFYKKDEEPIYIGETKITNGKDYITTSVLDDKFYSLSDSFCSLGQHFSYYENLKNSTGKLFESTLYALKDAAFFSDVHDKFEKNTIFIKSLLRIDNAERLLREAKHRSYEYNLTNLYSFKYLFKPKYSKEELEINFDFNKNTQPPNRIYAIIGKNGTGKTQLVSRLPLDISKKNIESFIPRAPLFSKVIAVSYSIFDNFEIPQKTSIFNYVYCGLHTINQGKREILTLRQRAVRFHNAWKKIKSLERMKILRKVLLTFIDESIVDSFIVEEEESNGLTVSIEEFNKIKVQLSSGQSIILYIISEILSNIRYDSLILFDEPETHLHPNAISQLINLIYDLVNRFDSYCIITTHSPLIIQELLSRNVFVMERHESISSIRKISIESFGENLSNLTEEVFGNKEISKQYKKIIDKLIEKDYSYNEIIESIESDNIPLSLNLRLYIKSQLLR
ncbi:MAG: AAA family ATPase [Chitinophagales bacterium]|nr:AAA family ATPase [Chitinophagales bacterium]